MILGERDQRLREHALYQHECRHEWLRMPQCLAPTIALICNHCGAWGHYSEVGVTFHYHLADSGENEYLSELSPEDLK